MVKMKLTNFTDVQMAKAGLILESQVRNVEIEALADTGAINMAIPEDVAQLLGAPIVRRQRVRVADGRSLEVPIVGGLLVEIPRTPTGRSCRCSERPSRPRAKRGIAAT